MLFLFSFILNFMLPVLVTNSRINCLYSFLIWRLVSLNREVWSHKTSLNPPVFIGKAAQKQESEWAVMYMFGGNSKSRNTMDRKWWNNSYIVEIKVKDIIKDLRWHFISERRNSLYPRWRTLGNAKRWIASPGSHYHSYCEYLMICSH